MNSICSLSHLIKSSCNHFSLSSPSSARDLWVTTKTWWVKFYVDGSSAVQFMDESWVENVCDMNSCWKSRLNKSYRLPSSEGFNASTLHLHVSLNGLQETRRTWMHVLIYPFIHGAWIKARSHRCSVDMSHWVGAMVGIKSNGWPLWMSAPITHPVAFH